MWDVPKDYDLIEREVVMPPPRGYLGTQPVLGILSVRALEDQAAGEGVLALVAWQTIGGFGVCIRSLWLYGSLYRLLCRKRHP